MKKLLLSIGILLLISSTNLLSAQNAKLTVKYSFKGLVEGYDHTSKTTLFLNGKELCTSDEQKQSKPMTFTCEVAPGTYTVRIVNYAYYENVWEEHTIANNYSIDAVYELEMTFKKKKKYTIGLLFDLDNGTSLSKK
ncbi:MAG TPA: hypothetical protein VFM99_04350 [Chitinophagales bacterium]|nr:hypothetical protein [Chitinophagales bacterium]